MTIKKGPFPRETGLCIVFSFVRLQTRFPPAGHDKYNDTDEDRQRVPNGNDVRSQFHHDTSKLLHAMCDVNRRFFVDCRAKQPAHTPAHGAHATRPHARNRYVTPFQLPNDFYLTRRKKLKDGFMTQGLNLLFVPGTKFTTPLAPARGNCRVEKAPAQSYQHIHTYPQRRKRKVAKEKEEIFHYHLPVPPEIKHTRAMITIAHVQKPGLHPGLVYHALSGLRRRNHSRSVNGAIP